VNGSCGEDQHVLIGLDNTIPSDSQRSKYNMAPMMRWRGSVRAVVALAAGGEGAQATTS